MSKNVISVGGADARLLLNVIKEVNREREKVRFLQNLEH